MSVRWLLINPALPRPRAYLLERTARRFAESIAAATFSPSVVQKQKLENGKWVPDGEDQPQQEIHTEAIQVAGPPPWKLIPPRTA